MRLGEIKSIIKEVLDEENKINIENEEIYSGQAQSINNFIEIMSALDVLEEQEWNDADFGVIEEIKNKYSEQKNPVNLSQDEFNQLNSYISTVNEKVPLFYGILGSMVEEQEEQAINILLPSKEVGTLDDLAKLNKRLDKNI